MNELTTNNVIPYEKTLNGIVESIEREQAVALHNQEAEIRAINEWTKVLGDLARELHIATTANNRLIAKITRTETIEIFKGGATCRT